jgi:hypothetical protein
LAALTAALDFHFLAVVGGGKRGAAERQCGIPWEISSYFAWLKQTYVLLTELAGMRFSGLDLLKATMHIYMYNDHAACKSHLNFYCINNFEVF